MNKRLSTLRMLILTTLTGNLLYASTVYAGLAEQCLIGIPIYQRTLVNDNINTQPVFVESDSSVLNYPHNVWFEGNVDILQGNRHLQAERAEIQQTFPGQQGNEIRTVTATGNVNYDDHLIKLNGSKIWSNLNNKDIDIFDSSYQMIGRQGRGTADQIQLRDNRYQIIKNGTFTSCLPNSSGWNIIGSEIIHDRQEEVAEIWNARFRIGSIPVFYSPYLQLPTGSRRRSGLLIPFGSYSNKNNIQFALPYYWNIAPNIDATLTPNYISERGTQLQNEFRYRFSIGSGLMQFDWLDTDKQYHQERNEDTRWLFHWQHNGTLYQVWRFNVDYTKTSDKNYLNDLDTLYGSSTDGYVNQKYKIGYANEYWDTSLQVKQFQVFSDGSGNKNAFRAEPQLNIHNYLYDLGPVNLQTEAQIARFSSENPDNPKATRIHIEPTLSLPIANSWGAINTELKLMGTRYQQEIPNGYNQHHDLKKSVTRFLPQYKINGRVIFDRKITWLDNYTQTLEPKIQYLYRSYKNQDNIYIYDSTRLQADYTGLFRDRIYSGLDRIASADKLVAGITSRLYDDSLDERFNVSAGQIYHFSDARTSNEQILSDKSNRSGSIVWAADSYWKLNQQFGARTGVQYSGNTNSIALGDVIMEYRQDSERMFQLNYRYASKEYVSSMITNNNLIYQHNMSQVGAVTSWPLTNNLAAVAIYYYDPRENQMIDGLFGIQYSNCCWAIGANIERKIVSWNQSEHRSEYDNKISFNFELRGLGGDHNLGTRKMLDSAILPYQPAH